MTDLTPKLLYGYGIIDGAGAPYMGECCVGDRIDMEAQAEVLNDDPDDEPRQPYRVVPLYYSETG